MARDILCIGLLMGLVSLGAGYLYYRVDRSSTTPPRLAWAPPPAPSTSAQGRRVAFQCSGRRKLFDANPAPPPCQAYRIESTVFADDAHVYWLDATGLRRLPLTANVGDPTSLVTGFIVPDPGAGTAEVVGRGPDEVAVLRPTAGGGIEIRRVDKASGVVTPVLTSATGGSRLASDGEYLYYLDDLAQLIEVHPGLPPFIATTTRRPQSAASRRANVGDPLFRTPSDPSAPRLDTAPPPPPIPDRSVPAPRFALRAQSVCAAHALTGGPVDGGPSVPSVAALVCAFDELAHRIRVRDGRQVQPRTLGIAREQRFRAARGAACCGTRR